MHGNDSKPLSSIEIVNKLPIKNAGNANKAGAYPNFLNYHVTVVNLSVI